MTRTVTVVDAATGATADVRIDAERTLADALPDLEAITGARTSAMSRRGVPLEPRQPAADLRDGDVLVLGAESPTRPEPVVTIAVTAGPDAGRLVALAPGRHALGREATTYPCTDPLMSRRHAELVVDADGAVVVVDLDSGNGTTLDAALPPGRPTPWAAGTQLRMGSTRLVHGRHVPAAATAPGPDGTTTVNRPPRLRCPTEPSIVEFPAPAQAVTTGRLPLLASVAPLLAGIVLALVLHRWEFLAFAVMSPLVVLGQAVTDRWSARRTNRRTAQEHADATAAATRRLLAAVALDAERRHRDAPDLAALVAAAVDRTTQLWHRGQDDDALTVRLGLGTVPSSVRTSTPRPVPSLVDVPVCIDLREQRFVGVCGDDTAIALARSMVVQVATLSGPGDLRIAVLAPGRGTPWAWARWLPHSRVAFTTTQLRARLDELATDDPDRHRLVVADTLSDPSLAATLAALPRTSVVWLGAGEATLPSACDTVVTVTADPRLHLRVRNSEWAHDDVRPDLVPVEVAEQVSRALAPLRDGGAASSLPTLVAWSQVHDLPLDADAAAASLHRRWAAGPTTTACLGLAADGPYVVDLRTDGPHVLVAGTTGAGKSELLQTLVASLAATNSPADLHLLLVDFKGGAAFGPCGRLPHTVGVLTDLDTATTGRAIESLTAELRRRERVLAAAGAPDLDTWRARAVRDGAATEELPRLVIVVDEFATLAEELPDFVGGLVSIAQRGRSLGVHLVLATQRPEGAVSADIRANARLRICLAVARENESRDVIDSPRAVTISRTTPGRALVRIGAHDLVEVQTARVCGPAARGRQPADVVDVVPLHEWDRDICSPPRDSGSPTELDLLVDAALGAAERAGTVVATRPWLPPLSEHVALSTLVPGHGGGVAVGVVDRPDRQSQPALTLPVDSCEPWLVVGGARSGRSTAALTFATALAVAHPPDEQHIWAVDGGQALGALAELPHTGAVVDVRDTERVDRLLSFLTAEVERRRSLPAGACPQQLLIVDSWDTLVASTGDADAGRCQDMLMRLLADGPGAGLRVLVTADRSGLTGRLSAAIPHRVCLRLPDASDYALVGLPPRRVPSEMPAGRGLRAQDLALVQIAVPDDASLRAARRWPAAARPPQRFDALPTRVPLHTLGVATHGLIVGLRGDDLAPVIVDPHDAGGAFLVAGPPRSGRSTALVSIAAQLRGRPVVALCSRRGPLHQRRDLALVADPSDDDATRGALAAVTEGATLLVDDIDLVDEAAALAGIEAAVRRARDVGGFVVLAGTTEAMAASFRGPVAQARRSRSGVLLRPEGPHDGELFGVRLRRRANHADPPGRGVLAMHGQVVAIQLPDPA